MAVSLRTFDLPLFLAPTFAKTSTLNACSRSFATSAVRSSRQNREKNKKRGVSAIRSTGPRVPLKVYKYPLPEPVENPERRSEFKPDSNHGLWGFFNEARQPMLSPEEESSFGRPWTYQELSVKDWEDLYKLYWTCILELNRTGTRAHEMMRTKAGYGENEVEAREKCIRVTMRGIRDVLRDRHANYSEARSLLERHEDVKTLLAEPGDSDEYPDEALEDDDDWQEVDESPPSQQVLPPEASSGQPQTQQEQVQR